MRQHSTGSAWTPAQEFKILKFFVQNAEQVIPREELLNEAFGYHNYPSIRTVDNHILKLRQKLEKDSGNPVHFRTGHGAGYTSSCANKKTRPSRMHTVGRVKFVDLSHTNRILTQYRARRWYTVRGSSKVRFGEVTVRYENNRPYRFGGCSFVVALLLLSGSPLLAQVADQVATGPTQSWFPRAMPR